MIFKKTLNNDLKRAQRRALPPIPDLGWEIPTELPDLIGRIKCLSFDVETKDLFLLEYGPGWSRKNGCIVGLSIGVVYHDNFQKSWYFPIRHNVGRNLDPTKTLAWLKELMATPDVPKIGANIIYDIGWLAEEGIEVKGELHDVQYAEALLHEDGVVNLEYLGNKYCGIGKTSDVMYEWLADAYGGKPDGKQRANIYRAPSEIVGAYGESDADLPIAVLMKQWPLLEKEGLMPVYRMECDLIPMMVKMRQTGVRVDMNRTMELRNMISSELQTMEQDFFKLAGFECNVNSNADLAKLFDNQGLKYNRTKPTSKAPDGNPSFTSKFLEALDHPVGKFIREIREHQKLISTFIDNAILNAQIDGRLHGQFHQLRSDGSGTRSGRFSASTPNLQQIPSRSKLGKLLRTIFVPDEGHYAWCKLDYSQIEYRKLVHFAIGQRSDEVRQEYINDPKTDYHDLTKKLVYDMSGMDIERGHIKTINFGLLYGMGLKTLQRNLGVDQSTAKQIFEAYHKGNPYIKETMAYFSNQARQHGYVTTIMGRKSRFERWVPAQYDPTKQPLPYETAVKIYGTNIIRAETHKAVNRVLQGSAADIMKMGMLKAYNDGIFDVTGIPKLTIHDELDFSMIDNSAEQIEAYRELIDVMENAIPLKVPVLFDWEVGPNWGEVQDVAKLA